VLTVNRQEHPHPRPRRTAGDRHNRALVIRHAHCRGQAPVRRLRRQGHQRGQLRHATYSTDRGHALVGSRLYVPGEQLADDQVRTEIGIPASLAFKTKPELGLDLLAEYVAAGIDVPWCTADAVYGRDRKSA
jgi:hypothetical protein